MKKEAMLYENNSDGSVHCYLCAHHCRVDNGRWGVCGVRSNICGNLFTSAYGEVIEADVEAAAGSSRLFSLGKNIYSLAVAGCNFKCTYCNCRHISQISKTDLNDKLGYELNPRDIVENALENNCQYISFGYSEPTVYFEYMYDIAKLAKKSNIKNAMATNGYMTKEALDIIKPYIDVYMVNLMSMRDYFYKEVCCAKVSPVLETIKYLRRLELKFEVYTTVVPGKNDSDYDLKGIAEFIAGVGRDIPWHIIRLEPSIKYIDSLLSPREAIQKAKKLGREKGLRVIDSINDIYPAMV